MAQKLNKGISTITEEQLEEIDSIRKNIGLDEQETMLILCDRALSSTIFGDQHAAPMEKIEHLKILSEGQAQAAIDFLQEYDPEEDDEDDGPFSIEDDEDEDDDEG